MAPHEAGIAFEIDVSDIEAGIRVADRMLRPRTLEVLDVVAMAMARRARTEHGYQDRTGTLTKSIVAGKARKAGSGAEVEVIAGANYAAAQEFGAKPHVIRARKAQALRFFAGGQLIFRRQVNHPGNPEQAFLANALDAELGNATDLIATYASEAFHEAGFA